jgi:hypothetical protein
VLLCGVVDEKLDDVELAQQFWFLSPATSDHFEEQVVDQVVVGVHVRVDLGYGIFTSNLLMS